MDVSERIAALITGSRRTVALTGAGISTAAGIPDFRGKEGIYTTGKYPPSVFDLDAFHADPVPFFRFARDFLVAADRITPTFTHRVLASLERRGLLAAVITQNIDGLHQRAGSSAVVELHGGFSTATCSRCGRRVDGRELVPGVRNGEIPRCTGCGGILKPDIVFFGEEVSLLPRAADIAAHADLMLVLGSSLTVYPAAGLPSLVPGTVVVINRDPVVLDHPRAFIVQGEVDEILRQVVHHLGLAVP